MDCLLIILFFSTIISIGLGLIYTINKRNPERKKISISFRIGTYINIQFTEESYPALNQKAAIVAISEPKIKKSKTEA